MKYEIDQSNKIEQTERDTVIAISNDIKMTILLKRQHKRILQTTFRRHGRQRFFAYLTFSALVALLLKRAKPIHKVTIDQEYQGHEDLIIQKISFYLGRLKVNESPKIEFARIGKTSPAHKLAANITLRGKKANFIVKTEFLTKLIFNNKKDRESKIGPRTA